MNALNEEPVPQFVPIGIFTVSLALRNPCSNHISLYSFIPVDMFVPPSLIDSTISFLYILEPLNVPISFSEVDISSDWDTEFPCLVFRIHDWFYMSTGKYRKRYLLCIYTHRTFSMCVYERYAINGN